MCPSTLQRLVVPNKAFVGWFVFNWPQEAQFTSLGRRPVYTSCSYKLHSVWIRCRKLSYLYFTSDLFQWCFSAAFHIMSQVAEAWFFFSTFWHKERIFSTGSSVYFWCCNSDGSDKIPISTVCQFILPPSQSPFPFETMAFKRAFTFLCNCKTSTISGPLCIDSYGPNQPDTLSSWLLFAPMKGILIV